MRRSIEAHRCVPRTRGTARQCKQADLHCGSVGCRLQSTHLQLLAHAHVHMTCCVCRHMHMRMYVAYGIGASRKRLRVAAVVHSSSSTRRAASARRCALGSMHAAARVHGRAACNPRRQRWQPHVPVPRLQPCVPTDRCPLGAPYLPSISPLSPLYLAIPPHRSVRSRSTWRLLRRATRHAR